MSLYWPPSWLRATETCCCTKETLQITQHFFTKGCLSCVQIKKTRQRREHYISTEHGSCQSAVRGETEMSADDVFEASSISLICSCAGNISMPFSIRNKEQHYKTTDWNTKMFSLPNRHIRTHVPFSIIFECAGQSNRLLKTAGSWFRPNHGV